MGTCPTLCINISNKYSRFVFTLHKIIAYHRYICIRCENIPYSSLFFIVLYRFYMSEHIEICPVGINLGTSTSAMGVFISETVKLLENEDGM